MYEVELKVPADHDAVEEGLDREGATHVESVTQEDTYYDAPDREFVETGEALRIRRETTEDGAARTAVTYKGPLVEAESKTREEAETLVEDDEAMAAILTNLGYDGAATVTKERDSYELDGCTVTLDTVAGLGEFVEVELDVDGEEAITAAREQAAGVLETLGLDPADQIRTAYLDLLLDAQDEGASGDQ